jgi:uncharacterized membrane protein
VGSKGESKIRISFGENVSMALGLLIAGEILSTIEAPSLNKLYVIALTVIIRILVGLFVFLEEKRAERLSTAGAEVKPRDC